MRILFICQYFSPDITAAAFRMSDFARLLAESGEEVRVITSYPHRACVENVDDSSLVEHGVQLERCHIPAVGGGAKSYIWHYLGFVRGGLKLGWRIWREGWRPDVIYTSSPPLFVGIIGRVLSVLFRRPVVFEVRDIWPDAAVSAGQLSQGGTGYRIGRFLERYFYRKAAHITCVASPMRDYLVQHAKVPVTVVYNGVSKRAYLDRQQQSPDLGKSSKSDPDVRTLLYAGNLGHVQQLDLLLHSMAELKDQSDAANWRLVLLGAGAQLENLQRVAEQLQVADRVEFRPAVTRDEAARQLASADMLYLHLMSDETMERTIPSKVFDYLLAARPIVAGLSGEGRDILESTGANIVFQPGNQQQMTESVLAAIRSWEDRSSRADNNRELVLSRFTREAAVEVLQEVFRKVAGKPRER